MNFGIGQRISGYTTEGEPVLGRITAFIPTKGSKVFRSDDGKKVFAPLARLRLEHDQAKYVVVDLDTCHPLPADEIKHSKATFLAAASRCSPVLHFKSNQDRRDYLEGFWTELQNFSSS